VWNGNILCDQEQETESKKRLQELERFSREKERELTRQLDEATIAASQEALERTRLANDKLHLEQELRRHEAREAELVRERKDRENCLLVAREQLDKEVHPSCYVEETLFVLVHYMDIFILQL
jgi:hypothetical protein